MQRRISIGTVLAALAALLASAVPAFAGPVATDDGQYQAYGRVFPDPLGGCQYIGNSPCDPGAKGNIGAKSFVAYGEFVNGILFMNQNKDWQRYMEVWPLDGKLDPGGAGGREQTSGNLRDPDVPGNNLPASSIEFEPKASYISAGIPQTDLSRLKSDLIVVRVTDETVPDAHKKRYALSLSIHGIERAGAEGGIRAMEDLVTAVTEERLDDPIVSKEVRAGAPKIRDVLANSIVYFTFPNPDGWRRGSFGDGGFSFQRYNGNGMDPNRDWPDIGFSYRFYSGVSEPETKGVISFYQQVMKHGPFAAGDDLHGQPFADALSYTMLPHGSHDWDKNLRLLEAAKRINKASYDANKWSPIIQSNDKPKGGGPGCAPDTLGEACAQIYAQSWGTVYDTINYTTTGALGDWFDSHVGMNAEGIDNEMSFSHLDKDTRFDPHTEQLHVDGNKAIIYSHIAQFLDPPSFDFNAPGRKGYVPNKRLHRDEQVRQAGPPPGTVAQDDINGDADPSTGTMGFEVKSGPQSGGKNIYNGGMRVEVTAPNAQGVTADSFPGNQVYLKVQCQKCDTHRGTKEADADAEWITVAEDFNQQQLYLASGLTASVNQPQALDSAGKPIKWRILLENHAGAIILNTGGDSAPPGGPGRVHIVFMQDVATTAGNTGGDAAPRDAGYDIANTDFIRDLNRFVPAGQSKFQEIDPRKVLGGEQSLDGLANLVLADDPLPGFTGSWSDPPGPPPADIAYTAKGDTHPGFWQAPQPHNTRPPGSYETVEFKVKPEETADGVDIEMKWTTDGDDWDMYLYRKTEGGSEELVSSEGTDNEGTHEVINHHKPLPAGDYVIYAQNWLAEDPNFTLTAKFLAGVPPSGPTGEYTNEERDQWLAKLRDYVDKGGNLVLTDGALRALPGVTALPKKAISQTTVYAGQVAFEKAAGQPTNNDVLVNAPLTINQPGSRFNTGMRKQMFEPTPVGFAIQAQDKGGAFTSNAVQWDIDRKAYEAIPNARLVATSADSGTTDAIAVHDRVAMGEVKVGKGQVRFLGALLPQPTEKFDHEFGLEPHAVTVAGYLIFRDLLASKEEQAAGTVAGEKLFYKRKPRFLISRRAARMTLKGVVPVRVSCRAPGGCKGTLTLRRGKKLLGKKKFKLKANRRATLRVKLKPTARRSVRRRPRTRVAARAAVVYGSGRRESVGPVRLRVSRPRG